MLTCPFYCRACRIAFSSYESLQQHLDSKHGGMNAPAVPATLGSERAQKQQDAPKLDGDGFPSLGAKTPFSGSALAPSGNALFEPQAWSQHPQVGAPQAASSSPSAATWGSAHPAASAPGLSAAAAPVQAKSGAAAQLVARPGAAVQGGSSAKKTVLMSTALQLGARPVQPAPQKTPTGPSR
jgi:hypothetical protein